MSLVNTLHQNLEHTPVTAKFRVFDDVQRTVEYAQLLERAGAQILSVHGRTREMKGQQTVREACMTFLTDMKRVWLTGTRSRLSKTPSKCLFLRMATFCTTRTWKDVSRLQAATE